MVKKIHSPVSNYKVNGSKAYQPLTAQEEHLAKEIVDCAYTVHRAIGPGLLESIYEACMCHELEKRSIPYDRQVVVPIIYDGIEFNEGFRLDILVDKLVICEIKSVETMIPVFKAQLLSYMRLTQKRLGFLVNFNVPIIKYGIERLIL